MGNDPDHVFPELTLLGVFRILPGLRCKGEEWNMGTREQ